MTDAMFDDFSRDTQTYLAKLHGYRPELAHGGEAKAEMDMAMTSLLNMVSEAAKESDPERTPLLVPRLPRSAFERD